MRILSLLHGRVYTLSRRLSQGNVFRLSQRVPGAGGTILTHISISSTVRQTCTHLPGHPPPSPPCPVCRTKNKKNHTQTGYIKFPSTEWTGGKTRFSKASQRVVIEPPHRFSDHAEQQPLSHALSKPSTARHNEPADAISPRLRPSAADLT